jgi:branched-chain amino acid transport system permease protein
MALVQLSTVVGWLTYSALLSLMGLGISLLYRTTKVPNFAHAAFITFGAYITYTVTIAIGHNPYLGLPFAFVLVGLVGLVEFYVLLEPLRRRRSPMFMLMIATLSFDIIGLGFMNILAESLTNVFKLLSVSVSLEQYDFYLLGAPGVLFVALGIVVLTVTALYSLLKFTTVGIALRCSMENTTLSEFTGINVSRMLALSWFIAGGIGGVAGALLPLWSTVGPGIGDFLIPSMFAVSIVGGLGEIYGAVLGGFLLGFVDIIGTSVLASVVGTWVTFYEQVVPLIVLSATLVIIPKGLASVRIRRGK